VSYVVSFDPAVSLDGHVHRVGRCGRGGSVGRAFAFLGSEDVAYAQLLQESMKSAGQAVPND
ncbi:rok1, partial [Symbiodinium pilosum]